MSVTVVGEGEALFMTGCVEAIVQHDTSKKHLLVLDQGKVMYMTVPEPVESYMEIHGQDGTEVKYICALGEELITEFHRKVRRRENKAEMAEELFAKFLKNVKFLAAGRYKVKIM